VAFNSLSDRINEDIIDYIFTIEFDDITNKPHIHALLKLNKPLNTYNQNLLNLVVSENGDLVPYHGNYQSAKS